MAGIHVSGGTYSGSGDVTIDYFKAESNPYYVWLPDGTMTITSESGSYCFYAVWPGSQDNWKHQNGTVKVTTPAGTLFHGVPVNADSTGRVGQFYNIEVNQNAYGASKDPVIFSSATEGGHLKLGGNLTITSGTFSTNSSPSNANYLYEVVGGLIIGASGAFNQGWSGDAGFPVGFQYNGYGDLKVGHIEGKDYNGGDGVQLVLSSGNTTINSSGPSDRGFVFHDQRAGHVFHSSGTVRFEPGAGVTQKLRWSTDGLAIYNAVVSGGASSFVKGFMSGADYLTFTNDLTIDAGTIGTYGDKLRVTGNVVINDGTLDTNTTNGTTTPHAMGSLYIKSDGIYNATAYETLINKINGDSYKFRNEDGTFTHNNGTVTLDLSTDGGFYKNTGSAGKYLYNLIVKNDTTSARVSQNIGDVTVSNNLIVSGAGSDAASWDAGFYNAGAGGYVVSGLTTVINGAKLGRGLDSNSTFGKLTIGAKGWYDAPTGSFTLTDDFTIPSDDTIFTHNSGTCVIAGGVELLPADYDSSETARHVFWDISQTGPGTFYIERPTVLERNFTKSGGDLAHYTKLTCGTDTSASTIAVNSGEWKMYGYYGDPYLYAKNEAFPVSVTGSVTDPINWDQVDNVAQGTKNHIKWIYYTKDTTTGGNKARIVLDGASEFQAMTISTNDNVDASNAMLTLNGTMTAAAEGIIVSGALVNMKGAGNWSETGQQQHIGRATAALMWNSTGYYSPNGSYLNNGWKDVFWNADARINQDSPFRNSNLIVAKQFSAQNRAIGSTSESQMLKSIRVVNGGTVSSSTNLFKIQNTGTFNTRGGFFASSSALDLDGTEYATMGDGMGTATAVTLEAWVKPSEAPYENTMIGTDGSKGGILSSNTLNKIRIKHESVNSSLTDVDYNWVVDEWVNICFTWDGSTGKVYTDGILLKSFALSGSPYDLTKACIGALKEDGIWPWEGNIARASIWKSALTGAEIRKMMFYGWDSVDASSIDDTKCCGWYQFNEGVGASISDMSGSGNTATITGSSPWATAGNWNANTLSGAAHTGKLYIGTGVTPTVFTNSTFELSNRELIAGSKFASKSHKGTTEYYVATSGTNDYLNYQKLEDVASIGALNDLKVLADGSNRSYFNFDSNANNEQCNTFVNSGYIRIVDNADFYTQDFDNSQGIWERGPSFDGIIHDDGSTPHEYEPIDLMDDQDSNFDTSELID